MIRVANVDAGLPQQTNQPRRHAEHAGSKAQKAQWQLKNQANARCCDNASPDDSGANRLAPPLTAALTAQHNALAYGRL